MSLIELKNVSRCYRRGGIWSRENAVRAVDGVSLTIEPGKCLALVGTSGSGKSTLGRLVLGLERPDSGEVRYRGVPLTALQGGEQKRARRSVQAVFQNAQASVNPRFTAEEIIGEPLRYLDAMPKEAAHERAAELMLDVGLKTRDLQKLPHQFSGGELQRVCIARALAVRPELIVLDEAVSALDMLSQVHVLKLLQDIRQRTGTAYLFISHDLRAVANVADSMAIMEHGRIAGTIENLDTPCKSKDFGSPAFLRLMGAVLPAGF